MNKNSIDILPHFFIYHMYILHIEINFRQFLKEN